MEKTKQKIPKISFPLEYIFDALISLFMISFEPYEISKIGTSVPIANSESRIKEFNGLACEEIIDMIMASVGPEHGVQIGPKVRPVKKLENSPVSCLCLPS